MDALDSSSQSGLFKQKIALLIDFDNMILGIEDPGFDIEIVVNALRERGVMVLGRAYGDWYRHARHRRRLMEYGIDLIETPVFGPIIKNSADMHMALDAFEIAHTQSHIDTFCIVSGDSDFLPLIKRLQTRDKHVIVIAGQKFTSELVRRNCNEYISYENLLAEMMGAHEDVSVIEGAYQLLERAIETLHERGIEARSSTLKQMMMQLNPMFSERTFGHSQFRQFLDRATRAGVARVERDARSGELLVKLVEENIEARAEARADARADPRPDTRGNGRVDSRLEPRDRFDRFDRFEPRDDRSEGRSGTDRREPSRNEPRFESRPQNRAEPVPVAVPEPAVETASTEEVAADGAEAVVAEAREGRRRRGGRGRKAEASAVEVGAESVASEPAIAEAAIDAPQVLEAAPQSLSEDLSEPQDGAEEFIDRNSQLGRVPLRRGRLRFSARLGRTVSAEQAAVEAEAQAPAEAMSEAEAEAALDEIATPVLDALEADVALPESVVEAAPEAVEAVEAEPTAVEAAPEPIQLELTEEAAAPEAEPEAEAEAEAEPEAEAKPKRRAPRRRTRKKDAPEAGEEAPDAPIEAEATQASDALSLSPAPEADVAEASASAVEATPDVEAPVEVPAEEAAAEEAPAKAKRPARRRTRKKAGEAAASDADAAPASE